MKKFTIIHNFTAVASIEVIAETREEAFEKAKENDLELSDYNFELVTDIEKTLIEFQLDDVGNVGMIESDVDVSG